MRNSWQPEGLFFSRRRPDVLDDREQVTRIGRGWRKPEMPIERRRAIVFCGDAILELCFRSVRNLLQVSEQGQGCALGYSVPEYFAHSRRKVRAMDLSR
jgi:hypothetical protein